MAPYVAICRVSLSKGFDSRPRRHHNMGIMTAIHPLKLSALLLITMGRAESHDPPARS